MPCSGAQTMAYALDLKQADESDFITPAAVATGIVNTQPGGVIGGVPIGNGFWLSESFTAARSPAAWISNDHSTGFAPSGIIRFLQFSEGRLMKTESGSYLSLQSRVPPP